MSSSTTEVFNKKGVETKMNKIGNTFQEISDTYVEADKQMVSMLTTPDGAIYGEGATKVLSAWDENSGTLEDFMTTFKNWAALVSGMATQYADLETGTYKVKDGSPYSEKEIANRARDFHTTALKTAAGIKAFQDAQSVYYTRNKDKDYLQSYDNNGIAYTSVRRLENGKIVETKVYTDEQGNRIAEEEHWTWNDKNKKFERTTEYYFGGSIDANGQYNHTGLKTITKEDFKDKYNEIKAASEAQTGSGNTGSEPQAAQASVTVDTEKRTAEYDGYILSQEGEKTYITDPDGTIYEVRYDPNTRTYEYYNGDKKISEDVAGSLDEAMAKITEDDYAKGLMVGNDKFTVDNDGNLVEKNPFNIQGAENITMTTNYGDDNQPISYTIKDQDGNTITTLTPKEYEAIMTQKGTATVTENGKTVTFEVDKDKKIITKTTTDNKGVVSTETASIGDDGKVTVSYEYRDAGTEEMHKYSYEIPKDGETKTNIKYDGVNVTDEELQKLMLGTTNNGDGQTTSYSVSSEDGTFIEETKKGDELVKKVEIERDSDGTLKKSTTTTYYPSGSQSETNNYYDNGTTIRETVVETKNNEGKQTSKTTTKYNEKGQKTEEVEEGRVAPTGKYVSDDGTKTTTYNPDGTSTEVVKIGTQTYTQEFDNKGNRTYEKTEYGNKDYTEYYLDDNGKVTKEISYEAQEQKETTTEYKDGKRTSQTTTWENGNYSETTTYKTYKIDGSRETTIRETTIISFGDDKMTFKYNDDGTANCTSDPDAYRSYTFSQATIDQIATSHKKPTYISNSNNNTKSTYVDFLENSEVGDIITFGKGSYIQYDTAANVDGNTEVVIKTGEHSAFVVEETESGKILRNINNPNEYYYIDTLKSDASTKEYGKNVWAINYDELQTMRENYGGEGKEGYSEDNMSNWTVADAIRNHSDAYTNINGQEIAQAKSATITIDGNIPNNSNLKKDGYIDEIMKNPERIQYQLTWPGTNGSHNFVYNSDTKQYTYEDKNNSCIYIYDPVTGKVYKLN